MLAGQRAARGSLLDAGMSRSARMEAFSRRCRLLGRDSYSEVLRGSRKYRGELAILHVTAGPSGFSRLGIALPRRLVGSAVDRSRLKRIAREIFRRHEMKRAGVKLVLAARVPFCKGMDQYWAREFAALLGRALGKQ